MEKKMAPMMALKSEDLTEPMREPKMAHSKERSMAPMTVRTTEPPMVRLRERLMVHQKVSSKVLKMARMMVHQKVRSKVPKMVPMKEQLTEPSMEWMTEL